MGQLDGNSLGRDVPRAARAELSDIIDETGDRSPRGDLRPSARAPKAPASAAYEHEPPKFREADRELPVLPAVHLDEAELL